MRPGFTPQEDVQRFRGKKQSAMDAIQLPKGHILGWVPPSSASTPSQPLSKSAKKNAKRKEKRVEKIHQEDIEDVKGNWDDDEEEEEEKPVARSTTASSPAVAKEAAPSTPAVTAHSTDKPNWATASTPASAPAPVPVAAPASASTAKPTATPPATVPSSSARTAQAPRAEPAAQRQLRPVRPNNSSVVSKLAAELKKLDTK